MYWKYLPNKIVPGKYLDETRKPFELLRIIILSSSKENDLIINPFGGLGTTYALAEDYKRKWKGCELKKKYCEIITRIIQGVRYESSKWQTTRRTKYFGRRVVKGSARNFFRVNGLPFLRYKIFKHFL